MPDNRLDRQPSRAPASQPNAPSPRSEELLRLVADNVEDYAIFAIDLEGKCASWNKGVEKLLGYAEAEWIGRDACDIFTPEDNAQGACARELSIAREHGKAEDQRWHLRRDGTRFFANGLMMSLRDEAGALRGYAKIMRDDTRRKAAEDDSRDSRLRFDAALAVADLGTFEWDVSTDAVMLDERSRELFGFAPDEDVRGQQVFARIDAADIERVRSEVGVVLRDALRAEIEYRINLPDGTSRIIVSSNDVILGGEGKVERLFGVFDDITERKRAEAERERLLRSLERERARLTTIFAHAPAFVAVMHGPEHVFDLVNPAYLRVAGRRDVIGKSLREAFPDIEGQGYYELHDEVFRTGEPQQRRESPVTLRLEPDAPPEEKFIDILYQPLFDEDGSVSGIFTHGVDITEQVRARKAAEEANRIKDEFLATLSHELRTPLTSVLGWARMLRSGSLDPAAQERALATVERNALAQAQMIDDLLDIGRIITGKLRLDVREVDLPTVVAAAADTLRPAAQAKDIRLQILLDPQAAPVSGDPDRLQQVVWNLVSNAIKFTPKSGRVQVRLERINSHVEVVVSDTGRGIPAEFLPHVFDRFRQADQTTTRRHGGLGLGLAIVRQLVELHGGSVAVSSLGADQGATFTVHLPLAPVRMNGSAVEHVERAHPTARTGEPLDCPAELAGLRVLVVDDEPDTRELLAFVLANCGARVYTAGSAAEAFEALRRERPDVLVSDIGMPDEDGYSLAARVRRLPRDEGGATPAVALTAYARAEDRVRAFRSGFQVHIPKPVEPAELVSVVANLAGRVSET